MTSSAVTSPTPRSIAVLALIWNVPIGVLAYAIGFMTSYFMDDDVEPSDHWRFIAHGMVALTISTIATIAMSSTLVAMSSTTVKSGRMPAGRAVVTALLAGAVLHATFIALVVSLVN